MSNISGQLIKDSYNYVLQSDLISGIVYRIGGSVAENPKFISGLTVNANFTYSDGSEFPGFVLTCDATGKAVWSPVSGATSGVVVTGGTFDYSAGTLTLVLSNGVNVPISGLEDIYVTGGVVSGNSIVFSYNDTNTFEVSGITSFNTFTSYTASTEQILNSKVDINTFNSEVETLEIEIENRVQIPTFTAYTASTQPLILNSVTGGTYSGGTLYLVNNSGATIPISGFTTGGTSTTDTFVTGFSLNNETITLSQNRVDQYSAFNISLSGYVTNNVFSSYTASTQSTITNKLDTSGFTAYTATTETTINNKLDTSVFTAYTATTQPLILNSVTGGTYSGGTLFLVTNSGNTVQVTGFTNSSSTGDYLPLSGGTVSGNTYFTSGLSANTLFVSGLTQTSGITSTGGITFKQVTINSSYTATTSDYMIDVTSGTFSVTLPSAVGIQGRLLVVKNNGGGAVTVQPVLGQNIDDKPFIILGETNTIQLASNGSNWVAISYNISTVNSSTGVFVFTGLSVASTTTFRVAPVKGWVVDDTTNPLSPQLYYVAFSGGTYTATYLTSYTETYIYLTIGGVIQQSYLPLTEQERRQNIFLGKLGHANKTNIVNAFSQPDFVLSPLSQLRDMFAPIGYINGGVYPYASNPNLTFATTAGYLYGLGINFYRDTLNPSAVYVTGNTTTTFQYRTQTGGTTSNVTNIDVSNYDVNGTVTPITGTKATNQRVYLLVNGQFRVQYAQQTYQTLAAAVAGIATESFNVFSNFRDNGILIGILSVLSTATDLTDTSKAQFFLVSKFGETIGAAGGVSTTNLQQAYNNSSNPAEIVTNSTLGALHVKNGSGLPDNVSKIFDAISSGGTSTAFIRADGLISGSSVSTPGFTANTGGLTALTISATTYLNLPSATFTGGTVSGPTNFTGGLSSTTISATTYYNYPDTYVTGFSLTNDVITLSQNRIDSYSSFTVTLSGLTGTPQQIAYYNVDGKLTGDTNFTRLDETNNYSTLIANASSLNVNEYQQSSYDYDRVRNRVFNDDISLVGVTRLESQSFLSKVENTSGGTISSLEILESSGSFTYQDSGGTYCGFFYNSTNPGWSIVRSGTQYDYNLPQSAYVAGSVLTDVSGDGNLTWVVPTSSTFTGGTVSGSTNFTNGLTANTISATTYQNLPTYISAVTESANVFTVSSNSGSPTTITVDAVTGGTYSAGQITLSGTGNVNGTQISTKILPVALTVVSNTASTNASLSSLFTLTLTGNTTLATPTNGFSGQRIVYRLRQDGTGSKLLTLSSGFRSGPVTVTLSTAANTTDYLGVIYNEFDNKWDVLALNKGYS